MRVVLTGGGTGGHIIPFAPVIEALRTLHVEKKSSLPKYLEPKHLDITFMGVATPEARELFGSYSVPVINIPSGKLRRYASGLTIIDILFRLPVGILWAAFTLWRIMPDVVVSKSGYGSLPTVLAAALYRIPVLLHESDAVPGIATKQLSRFAAGIALGYGMAAEYLGTHAKKCVATGNPVRSQLRRISRAEGRRNLNISEEEFVLLVLGGSQGAKQINEALLAALPRLITNTTIIHVTGSKQFAAVQAISKELLAHSPRKDFYRAHGFLGEVLLLAMAAADAVVTRAGSTLAEIAAARKPALIIPLEGAANDHQRKNAHLFEAAGAALVLDPTNLGRNLFEQNVRRLRDDIDLRRQLSANSEHLDFPGAARDIANLAFYLAQGLEPKA